MNAARSFMLTMFAWVLFMACAFPFLRHEWSPASVPIAHETKDLTASLANPSHDLDQISGEQLIGMVPFALNGDYELYIDGIAIDQDTDISTIDLRNVPGLLYTLTVYRSQGHITAIQAVH